MFARQRIEVPASFPRGVRLQASVFPTTPPHPPLTRTGAPRPSCGLPLLGAAFQPLLLSTSAVATLLLAVGLNGGDHAPVPTASDGDDNKNPSGDAGTEEGLTTLRADAVGAWDTETSRIEQGFFHLFRLESVPLDVLAVRFIPIKQSWISSRLCDHGSTGRESRLIGAACRTPVSSRRLRAPSVDRLLSTPTPPAKASVAADPESIWAAGWHLGCRSPRSQR